MAHIIVLYCVLLVLLSALVVTRFRQRASTRMPPVKQVPQLTVEAQQILHDLTAHGQSIVRIVPLSPTDIFWRAPQ